MPGRPKKLTDAEKRAIIRNFVVEHGTTRLRSHNICALLSKFSNDKGYHGGNGAAITASDFRSDLCRQEIERYLSDMVNEERIDSIPVYVPFDIEKALNSDLITLEKKLREREEYYFNQTIRAGTAIKSYTDQENRYRDLLERYEAQCSAMTELQDKLSVVMKQNRLLEGANKELRKKIRENTALTSEEILALANQKVSDTNFVKLAHTDVLGKARNSVPKNNLTVITPPSFDDLL